MQPLKIWRITWKMGDAPERSFEVSVEKGGMAELICAFHAWKDGAQLTWKCVGERES